MKLSEKIVVLRKRDGLSQEQLAEKLGLSRQAISRWEQGSALPDALNILSLSKLFGVSSDYLLNDDFESDADLPAVKEVKSDNSRQIFFYLIMLEVMILIIQFMCAVTVQSDVLTLLSFIPALAAICGFEYAHRKNPAENVKIFRKSFYKASAWLLLYFPIRFVMSIALRLWPRPMDGLVYECVIAAVYLAAALCVNLELDKK